MKFDPDACIINVKIFNYRVRATVLQSQLKLHNINCYICSLVL